MKIHYLIFTLGILLSQSVSLADGINLVHNGSFESLDTNQWAAGWKLWPSQLSGKAAVDANIAYAGRASLRFSSVHANSLIGAEQVIRVKPHTKYIIKFRVRCETVVISPNGRGTFLFVGKGSTVNSTFHSAGPEKEGKGNIPWREYQIGPFDTGELTAFTLLPLFQGASGTVWYDDFRVYEVTENMQHKIEQSRTRAILLHDLKIITEAAEKVKDSQLLTQAEKLRKEIQSAKNLSVKFNRMKGPPLCSEHREVFALMANLLHTRYPKQDLIIQFADPFKRQYYLTPVVPDGLGTRAEIAGLRNDTEQIAINLTNTTDEEILAKISLSGGFNHKWRKVIPVELTEGIFIDDALPLAEMEGQQAIIDIPSGMTRQLWLEIRTDNKPGNFSGNIKVAWEEKSTELPLSVKITDLEFPEHWPIYTFCYAYLTTRDMTKDRLEQCTMDLANHHINTVLLHPWSRMPKPEFDNMGKLVKVDWSTFDELLVLRGKYLDKYIMHPSHAWIKNIFPAKFGSTEWEEQFIDYVQAVMKGLNKRGIKNEQILWTAVDEPNASLINEVLITGRAFHKAGSHIRVYNNFYSAATPADIKKMDEQVDIWAPSFGDCLNDSYLSVIKDKELWSYRVSEKNLTPNDIRSAFKKLARLSAKGYSFWTYADKSADSWDPYDIARHDYNVIYNGDSRELIPSKRWEAWREGVEDYTLIKMKCAQ